MEISKKIVKSATPQYLVLKYPNPNCTKSAKGKRAVKPIIGCFSS